MIISNRESIHRWDKVYGLEAEAKKKYSIAVLVDFWEEFTSEVAESTINAKWLTHFFWVLNYSADCDARSDV